MACLDQAEVKSPEPFASAAAFKGASAPPAIGSGGVSVLIGPAFSSISYADKSSDAVLGWFVTAHFERTIRRSLDLRVAQPALNCLVPEARNSVP